MIEIYQGSKALFEKNKQRKVLLEDDGYVKSILLDVEKRGDEALRDYTLKFDGLKIDDFLVTQDEIAEAYDNVETELIEALETSAENIEDFHRREIPQSFLFEKKGVTAGQMILPLESAGIYVPGGRAAYPSTVLMAAIPPKICGVPRIVVVTPPSKDGRCNDAVLVASDIAGVDEIYKVGGAQAIAALSYGTESIKPVSKIVGPGNRFVAIAKKLVETPTEFPAGPSEVMIIAEEKSNPRFIALDMLAQSEHDPMASAYLLTTSKSLAEKVVRELENELKVLPMKVLLEDSLKRGGVFIISSIDEAIELSNNFAPEHLEIMVNDPFSLLTKIKNAGSVFLGEYSPEAMGDYVSGTNHVLPTSGFAKFYSSLSVDDFLKKYTFQYVTKVGLKTYRDTVSTLARSEGLFAHEKAVKVRFEDEK